MNTSRFVHLLRPRAWFSLVTAAVAAAFFAPAAHAQNLLLNGGFDSSSFSVSGVNNQLLSAGANVPHWTWTPGPNSPSYAALLDASYGPQAGGYAIDLGAGTAHSGGSLSQDFTATAGTTYIVSYWLRAYGGGEPVSGQGTVRDLAGNVIAGLSHSRSQIANTTWTKFSFTFVAPATNLRFVFTDTTPAGSAGSTDLLLDSVVVLPKQSLVLLGGSGTAGQLAANTEYSTNNGATWHPAYLCGAHPWGFIPGTNNWINQSPSQTVGLYQTTWFRIRFIAPSAFESPTMSFQINADNIGEMTINGQSLVRTVGGGSYSTYHLGADKLVPGVNTVITKLTDEGGLVGMNYRVDISAYATQPFSIIEPAPNIVNVTSALANGTYKLGTVIPLQVVFTRAVNVTGTPTLLLNTGAVHRAATYVSGSGSTTLIFNYTVQPGDISGDLDYVSTSALSLNGGSIVATTADAAPATITPPAPGATGSLGANKAFVIDGIVPRVASVTRQSPTSSPTNVSAVTFRVTFSEPVFNLDASDFAVNAGSISSVTVNSSSDYNVNVGGLASFDGTLTLNFSSGQNITDSAGNALTNTTPTGTNNATYVLDHTPPTVAIASKPNALSASSGAGFTYAGFDAVSGVMSYVTRLDNGAWVPTSSATTTVSYTGLANGTHIFQIYAIDGANNSGSAAPTTYSWVVDTVPPETTITSGPALAVNTTSATFTFSGTDATSGVASFQASLDNGPYVTVPSPKTYSGLAEGTHVLNVRAIDPAGNVDPTPATYTWRVDTIAPDTAIVSQPASVTNSTSATFAFTSNESGATFAISVDGGAFKPATSPTTLNDLADGSHTFVVRAVDEVGNEDKTPASYTWTVDATGPVITVPTSPVIAEATGPDGASVSFTVSATDTRDGSVLATPSAASGSTFALGNTVVTVTATDSAGNKSTKNFTVTVRDTTGPEISVSLPTPPVLTETFNGYFGGTPNGTQYLSNLNVQYGGNIPGWNKAGFNAAHAVDLSGSGNWAVMFYATDVLTLTNGVAANASGTVYTVSFLAGPAVYQIQSQATGANDGLKFEILRADGTVLKTYAHKPGAYAGVSTLTPASFAYTGDGSGNVRVRVSTIDPSSSRFGGVLENFQIALAQSGAGVPTSLEFEATSPAGAVGTFEAVAFDLVSRQVPVTASTPSGSTFAIGTTPVTLDAVDAVGNRATATFNVIVRDTTKPVLTLPANITAEATSPAGATVTFTPTATDSASTPTVVSTPPSGSTFALGATTVNVTATDSAGLQATGSFTVTVVDTTPPALTVPADIVTEATSGAGASVTFTFKATDAASTPTIASSHASGDTFAIGTTPVSVTATDAAGLKTTKSFNITVRDTTPPVLNVPANITAEATSPAGSTVNFAATATDATGSPTIAYSKNPGTTFPLGSTKVAITATDAAGLQTSGAFTVTVVDTTPPVVNVPADFTVEATSSAGASATFNVTAKDIASTPTLVLSHASGATFPIGTTKITATATDGAGLTTAASFNITVRDTTPPVLNVPANITAEATSPAGSTVNFAATATDATGSPTIAYSKNPGTTFPLGSTKVAITATDAAGLQTSGAFTVTVVDTTPPVVNVPADITVEATSPAGASATFNVTSKDIASTPTLVVSHTSGATFPIGTTKITATATDGAGLKTTASFNVIVRDTTPPVLTVPANITAEATSAAGATINFAATATDTAGTPTITYSKDPNTTFAFGSTTVTVTATDAAGLTATGTFTVTVSDTTAPDTSIASTPVSPTSSTTATFTFAGTDSGSGVASFEASLDGGAFETVTSPKSYTGLSDGAHTFKVRAKDASGNVDSTPASFGWIIDATGPVITVPTSPVIAEATGPDGASVSFTVSATDARDGSVLATPSAASGSTFALGNTEVTVTATDATGNKSTKSFTVTVRDTTAPEISVSLPTPPVLAETFNGYFGGTPNGTQYLSNLNVQYGGNVPGWTKSGFVNAVHAVDLSGTGNWAVMFYAPDVLTLTNGVAANASGMVYTVSFLAGPAVYQTPSQATGANDGLKFEILRANGTVLKTYAHKPGAYAGVSTLTPASFAYTGDGSGHVRVRVSTIDPSSSRFGGVLENFQIALAQSGAGVPTSLEFEATSPAGAVGTFDAVAFDLVSRQVPVTASTPSGSTFAIGTTPVTLDAVDAAGNRAKATFNVIVRDTTKPVLSLPANITAEATSPAGAAVTFTPTATDTASTPTVVSTPPSGSTFALGATTVNVTATDSAGLQATGAFTVTVVDTTPPALTVPADIVAEATSGAGASVTFAVKATDAASTPTIATSRASGDTFAIGTTPVSVTATDAAGLKTTKSFNITVRDTTPPVLNVPANITAEATSPAGSTVNFAATATDATSSPSIAYSHNPGTTFPLGSTKVAITATDAAGLQTTGAFTVNVVDTTPPALTVPADIVAEATSGAGATVTFAVSAKDVASTPTIASSRASGDTFAIGTTPVSVTATDGAGLQTTKSFNITVRDTTPPVLNVPANITAEATSPAGSTVNFAATATDATSSPTIAYSKNPGTTFPLGSTRVAVTATDGAGLQTSGAFTVTVVDTTPPVVNVPADFTVEATSSAGASATFNVTSTDIASTPTLVVSHTSGATFPIGTTKITATATDGAGLKTSASFNVIVRDTTPPVLTVPANITAEATSAAGATVNFAATATDTASTPTIAYSKNPNTTFAFGSTTVTVTATDAAGNAATASFTVTVADTTAPVIAALSNLTLEATSASGAVASFAPTATDAVSTPTITTLPASGTTFALGTTTVNVTATDAAGNASTASFTVTVADTTKPALNLPADQTAEATSPAGTIVTFAATATDAVSTPVIVYSKDPGTTFPIGTTTVTVTATDTANNATTGSFNVTVSDTIAPETVLATTPPSLSKDASGTFTFSGTDSGSGVATFQAKIDGGAFATVTSPHAFSGLSDGSHTFEVRAVDAAGNIDASPATYTWTIDTQPPTIAIAVVSTDDRLNAAEAAAPLTISGSTAGAEDGRPVTVTLGGATYTANVSSNAWSVTLTAAAASALAEQVHTITANVSDAAGNPAAPASRTLLVDKTAPAAPVVAGISDDTGDSAADGITNDTTLVIRGTAEADSTVEVSKGGAVIGQTTANASGVWSFDYTGTTLAAGDHALTGRATDAAGNTGPSSDAFLATIDTNVVAPVIVSITTDSGSSATDGTTNDNTLIFAGTAEPHSTVALTRSGVGVIGTARVNAQGAWTFDYTGTTLADGSYLFTARTTDRAGNVSSASNDFPVVIDTVAPVIASGSASGTYKSAFATTVSVSGSPVSFGAAGLPPGVSLNATTGEISGTPTQSGTFSLALTATDTAGNSGHGTLTLTVNKVNLTVVGITANDKVYDASVVAALNLASASLVGVVAGDTVSVNTAAAAGAFADKIIGTAKPVAISGLTLTGADAAHYTFTAPTTTASITARTLTVAGSAAANKVYDGNTVAALSFTGASLVGIAGSDSVTLVTTSAAGTFATANVGTAKLVAVSGLSLSGADAANYALTAPTLAADVTLRPLAIAANAKTKVYGSADPALTFTITSGSLVAGESLKGALTRAAGENVGSYAITQSSLTAGSNYAIAFTPSSLAITPATLTITAAAQTKVYGSADPALTYSVAGLQFSDTAAAVLTGALARSAGENVAGGPYAIGQGTLTANSNYVIAYTAATLAITPAPLAVVADAKTKVYGAADPVLTYQVSGLQFSDTVASVLSGALTRATGETVLGSPYAIQRGTLAANTNYTLGYTGANLTITPATATIAVTGYTGVYDGKPHGATGTATGVGSANLASMLDLGAQFTAVPGGTANWTFRDPAGNYTDASGSVAIVITKAGATIAVTPYSVTYDGAAHTATGTAKGVLGETLAGLDLTGTTHTAAGTYTDTWTFTDVTGNYNNAGGSITDVIAKAAATIVVTPYDVIYDGTAHTAAGTAKGVNGEALAGLNLTGTTHTNAGTYNDTWTFTDVTGNYSNASHSVTNRIHQAQVTLAFGALTHAYDGQPKPVTVTTTPAGIAVKITYVGSTTAPTLPGSYSVLAEITDSNYKGTLADTLLITITSLVRHAPTLVGELDGSLQVLLPESMSVSGNALVAGDLLVPGTPTVRLNGTVTFGGTIDAAGAAGSSNHVVTLNGGAVVRKVVRRVDPLVLPTVAAPPAPTGTRNVTLNKSTDDVGDWSTLRNLTLNGTVGNVVVPAGTYGNLSAGGTNSFTLGVAGSSTRATYNLQNLTLNGSATLKIVGPVTLVLANGVTFSADVGNAKHPEWLLLRVASGGVTINSNADFVGDIIAPNGTVTITGGSTVKGRVTADRLALNANAVLTDPVLP